MGLRDKVALVLLTIVLTQVTIINSKPLKPNFDNLNYSKTTPMQKSFLPTKGIKSTKSVFAKSNNAKIYNDNRKNSMYKVYNFPEIEYPLDTSPKDPFYLETSLNSKPFEKFDKTITSQSQQISDLKKEMRMKRKLSRLTDNEYQTEREVPTVTKYSPASEPVWLKEQEIFPQVEYPMTAMETWGPRYWNPSSFTQNYNSDFATYNSKACEKPTIFCKPRQQLKSKTKQYMEEVDRLTEKMRKATANYKSIMSAKESNTTKKFITDKNASDLTKPESNTSKFINANNTFVNNKDTSENRESEDSKIQLVSISKDVEPEMNNSIPSKPFGEKNTSFTIEPNNNRFKENVGRNNMPPSYDAVFPDKTDSTDFYNVNATALQQESINSSPLNIKIPIPLTSIPTEEPADEVKQSHEKVPYTSVIVVPVGDSIRTVQLPMMESGTGAPIIVFVPTTHSSEKDVSSTTTNYTTTPNATKSAISNDTVPDISYSNEPLQDDINPDVQPVEIISEMLSSDPSNTAQLVIDCISEDLPINSMCHSITDSSSPPKETNQNEPSSDELFLEMLQPIIAITDTSFKNDPNIDDTLLPFVSDINADTLALDSYEGSLFPKEDLLLPQSLDTTIPNIEWPSIRESELLSSSPNIPNDESTPIQELFPTTSISNDNVDKSEEAVLPSFTKDPSLGEEQLNADISNLHIFDIIGENAPLPEDDIRDVSASDSSKGDFTTPIDIVLPMDMVIEMIKNGNLLSVNNFLDTLDINDEKGPVGPVVEIISSKLPVNTLDDDKLPADGKLFYLTNESLQSDDDEIVDLTKNILMAPQAMELKDTMPFTDSLNSKEFEPDTQVKDDPEEILPMPLDELMPDNHFDTIPENDIPIPLDEILTESPSIKMVNEDFPLPITGIIPDKYATGDEKLNNDSHMHLPTDEIEADSSMPGMSSTNGQTLLEDFIPDTSLSDIIDEKQNTDDLMKKQRDGSQQVSQAVNETHDTKERETSLNGNTEEPNPEKELLDSVLTEIVDDDIQVPAATELTDFSSPENTQNELDKKLLYTTDTDYIKDVELNANPMDTNVPETVLTDKTKDTELDKKPLETNTDIKDEKTLPPDTDLLELVENSEDSNLYKKSIDTKVTEIDKNDGRIHFNTDHLEDESLLKPKERTPTKANPIDEDKTKDKDSTSNLSPLDTVIKGTSYPVEGSPMTTARELTRAELAEMIKYLYMSL